MLKKVFNWSEVHLSEVTSYKIYTLVGPGHVTRVYCSVQKADVDLIFSGLFVVVVVIFVVVAGFFVVVSFRKSLAESEILKFDTGISVILSSISRFIQGKYW